MTKDDAIKAIEDVRARNAGNFERSGAVWEAYDKAVLDCHAAVSVLPDAGWREDDVNRVAVAMWRGESVRAAPNVAKQRTAEAFAEESQSTIDRWKGLARVALEVAFAPEKA